MQPARCVRGCARALTHAEVRSRPMLAAALRPGDEFRMMIDPLHIGQSGTISARRTPISRLVVRKPTALRCRSGWWLFV